MPKSSKNALPHLRKVMPNETRTQLWDSIERTGFVL